MKPASAQPITERSNRSRAWNVLLLLGGLLFVVFALASVNLIRTAISSQPDCVAHERVGTSTAGSGAPAAKSAC